jgi:photosystem II stability/assembly factor-like uncharacterized protein
MIQDFTMRFIRFMSLAMICYTVGYSQYSGSWQMQAFPVHRVRCVKSTSSLVAWAAGTSIYRTTNGGSLWTDIGHNNVTGEVFTIDAIDGDTAFVTTTPSSTTFIYKTSDGGSTWQQVFSQSGGFIDGIHMFDRREGVAIGDPVGGKWTIAKTTDGGTSWARISNEPVQINGEWGLDRLITYAGSSCIWFTSGKDGRIYRSSNRGESWDTIKTPWGGASYLSFSDSLHGFISNLNTPNGKQGAVTRDGGNTWSTFTLPVPTYAVFDKDTTDLWIGSGSEIHHSSDFGTSWTKEFTANHDIADLSFANNGLSLSGWAVGWISGVDTGGISGYTGTVTDVSVQSLDLPRQSSLSQNYPNPFNPSTTIHYALSNSEEINITVFTLLGEPLEVLVDGRQEAGTHEVNFNGSPYPSGVYFYRIQAGHFTEVKKLLFIR